MCTNCIGQILIKKLRARAQRWIKVRAYDADGRQIEWTHPSGVFDYDESYADLDVRLRGDKGLIQVTGYFAETAGVKARDRVQRPKLGCGGAGVLIALVAFKCAADTDRGITAHPLAKRTQFRHEAGTGAIGNVWYGTEDNPISDRSDTVLLTVIGYNDAEAASETVTPAGREDRQFFDAAGRTVKTIQNYVDGIVDIDHPDEDVTVETAYGPDGQVLTLVAKNPATGDQLTRYVYGTTLSDSGIASSQLKRAEIYPDSDDTTDPLGDGADEVYDRIEFKYNRQGEVTEIKDQNETIHAFDYDALGRRIHDRITTLGSGVDGAVRRISTTYEIRGMVEAITSWDDATVGNANVVNELAFEYNDLGMTVREYQEHAGAKDGNTLYVQYDYDTTASGGVFTHGLRPTSVRYPNGRRIHLDYGPTDGMSDALGRLAAIRDDDAGSPGDTLAEYAYLGLAWIVMEDYVEPEVRLDYDSGAPGEYAGFDRFGRVIDHRWYTYGASADLDGYTYTYDRAGNRTAKTNQLNHDFDEVYEYDAIDRLISSARADDFDQSWTLDALGNFAEFDDDGQSQTRTHNPVNEITGITDGWMTPTYDAAGNMISGPRPGDETTRVHYVYDAWNRLVIVKADDSGDPGDTLAEYQYDGTNRRIQKNVSEPGGGPSDVHYFYNHNWQLLEERFLDGQGAAVASNRYIWSPRYIGERPSVPCRIWGGANGRELARGGRVAWGVGCRRSGVVARCFVGRSGMAARHRQARGDGCCPWRRRGRRDPPERRAGIVLADHTPSAGGSGKFRREPARWACADRQAGLSRIGQVHRRWWPRRGSEFRA